MRRLGLDIAQAVIGEGEQQIDARSLGRGDERIQLDPVAFGKLILQWCGDQRADGIGPGLPRQTEIRLDQGSIELVRLKLGPGTITVTDVVHGHGEERPAIWPQ